MQKNVQKKYAGKVEYVKKYAKYAKQYAKYVISRKHNYFRRNMQNLNMQNVIQKKGLSFISNRQRQKEGTFCASVLAGIETTPARSGRAGYARLSLLSTQARMRHRY